MKCRISGGIGHWSDQGQHPYLDEALALYSELLYRALRAGARRLVVDFRVNATRQRVRGPAGLRLNAPRPYINAVYCRARMMHDLRKDLGDVPFFGWLQRYTAQMSADRHTRRFGAR